MKPVEHIPLERISDEFPVVVATPPPHRNNLSVYRPALANTLRTLKAQDYATTIYFFRDEPKVAIAPKGNDHVEAITGQAHAKPEKEKRAPAVSYVPAADTILIHIPYRDHETTTPTDTARSLSKNLRRAFGSIPGAKYPHSESFQVEPILGEWEPPMINAALGFVTSLPLAGIVTALASIDGTRMNFFQTYGFFFFTIYACKLYEDVTTIWDYRRGRIPPNDWRHANARLLSQNMLRMIYPTTYVHEVLTPGLIYTIKNMAIPDILKAR